MLQFDDGIAAVDTEYLRPQLAAVHLIVENGRAALVDAGTNHSVPLVLRALGQQNLDIGDVDYLFLTHIHLDHAGGAGALMQQLPNARCVVHPRGARHMVNPEKLIAGTQAVYGVERTFEMYGELRPVEEARVLVPDDGQIVSLNGRELDVMFTEGHARHHYCLCDDGSKSVFTGDSFGISYREFDSENGEFVFPTTTPVHFDPQEAHRSIDRILAREPAQLYLTHYSQVRDLQRLAADMHECIDAFVALARELSGEENRTAVLADALQNYLAERVIAHGCGRSRDEIDALLKDDADLNAQGLDVWLHRNNNG